MKPITINLIKKRDVKGRLLTGCLAVFVFAALGLTIVNVYDYLQNTKVIREYQDRIRVLNDKKQKQASLARNVKNDKEERLKLKAQKAFYGSLIEKHLVPVSGMLTRIETIKPDRVNIKEVYFKKDLHVLVIQGESNDVGSVSEFLIGLDRSENFSVEITQQEIGKDSKIEFELTARWTGGTGEKKI
mgnify:CR=1 FL=1